jgi:hypothetical protein
MDHFYLFLSSKDSNNFYPTNKASDFLVELPHIIYLEGKWEVALTEIDVNGGLNEPLYLCTNVCVESHIRDTGLQLLRVVVDEDYTAYQVPYYMRVSVQNLHHIRIHLRDKDLQEINSKIGELSCVLHFKQISKHD